MDFPFTGLLKDFMAMLGAWPRWKELGKAPDRIDELEKRLEALEEKAVFPRCPHCGRPTWQMTASTLPRRPPDQMKGIRDLHFRCLDCGFEDVVRRIPE